MVYACHCEVGSVACPSENSGLQLLIFCFADNNDGVDQRAASVGASRTRSPLALFFPLFFLEPFFLEPFFFPMAGKGLTQASRGDRGE